MCISSKMIAHAPCSPNRHAHSLPVQAEVGIEVDSIFPTERIDFDIGRLVTIVSAVRNGLP